jgi:hypothetical protein
MKHSTLVLVAVFVCAAVCLSFGATAHAGGKGHAYGKHNH